MKNQLTTIASLPGSGSGCQSALPAEVGKAGWKAADPLDAWFQPIPRERDTVTVNIITGATTTTAQALRLAEQIKRATARRVFLYGEAGIPSAGPNLLDAAGGGE